MIPLTPREHQTVRLLALGANTKAIAKDLAISEHTVKDYIKAARFKMSARNTAHLTAKATAEGLV